MERPVKLIIAGAAMLIFGALIPLLMVAGWLESTLPLNFLAALSSTVGLMVGLIGIVLYVRQRRGSGQ